MNDGGIVFDVTHVRGFAEDLWYRIGDDGDWGRDLQRALRLIVGSEVEENVGRDRDTTVDTEALKTFGLSGHDYFGKTMGKRQGENLAALVEFALDTRKSVFDLAKGAAVIAENFKDEDDYNGEGINEVYNGFDETPPHGV